MFGFDDDPPGQAQPIPVSRAVLSCASMLTDPFPICGTARRWIQNRRPRRRQEQKAAWRAARRVERHRRKAWSLRGPRSALSSMRIRRSERSNPYVVHMHYMGRTSCQPYFRIPAHFREVMRHVAAMFRPLKANEERASRLTSAAAMGIAGLTCQRRKATSACGYRCYSPRGLASLRCAP